MPDEYWIVVDSPRFERFKLPSWIPFSRRQEFFKKVCEYSNLSSFVEVLQNEFPEYVIRIGVTRGNDIYLLR